MRNPNKFNADPVTRALRIASKRLPGFEKDRKVAGPSRGFVRFRYAPQFLLFKDQKGRFTGAVYVEK